MSKKLSFLVIVLLIVPLILTACGDDNKKEDKAVNLNQTFTSTNHSLSLKYPEGWLARDGENAVELGNKQDALDVMTAGSETEIPKGSFGLQVIAMPLAEIGMAGQPIKDILTAMSASMSSEDTKVGEVKELKIGGKDGARVGVTTEKQKAEGFVTGFLLDENIVIMVVGVAHQGELSQYEDAATKIAETVAAAPAS